VRALPASVLWPAYAGVLPFAALTLGLWVLPPGWRPAAGEALLGYGAVILSFVGALHWGHALLRRDEALRAGQAAPVAADRAFLFSVCPALAGWTALQLPFVPALGVPALPAAGDRGRAPVPAGGLGRLGAGHLRS
jgi:hypothetical protein